MLKQSKRKNFIKRLFRKKFRKTFARTNKLLNTTFSYYSRKNSILNNTINWPKLKVIIRVTTNNTFCTLIKDKKIIYVGSAGIYKLKVSQKTMKFIIKSITKIFYDKIKSVLNDYNSIFIEIIAPLKVKKFLIKGLSFLRKKKKNLIINIKPKKCFNGCVPPKKIRKRKRKMRIFK